MATTLEDARRICTGLEFTLTLKIVLAFLADEILQEPATKQFHLTRVRWANRFLNHPETEVRKACLVMSLVPSVNQDTSDKDLISAVRQKINTFAGAFSESPEPRDGIPGRVIIEEIDDDNNPNTPLKVVKRTITNVFRRQR